jgi:hypothetical protein
LYVILTAKAAISVGDNSSDASALIFFFCCCCFLSLLPLFDGFIADSAARSFARLTTPRIYGVRASFLLISCRISGFGIQPAGRSCSIR